MRKILYLCLAISVWTTTAVADSVNIATALPALDDFHKILWFFENSGKATANKEFTTRMVIRPDGITDASPSRFGMFTAHWGPLIDPGQVFTFTTSKFEPQCWTKVWGAFSNWCNVNYVGNSLVVDLKKSSDIYAPRPVSQPISVKIEIRAYNEKTILAVVRPQADGTCVDPVSESTDLRPVDGVCEVIYFF